MKLAGVTHFFNESLLLPAWIEHHKDIFDVVVGINHKSSDNSVELWHKHAPPNWQMMDTRLDWFQASALDEEVMDVETHIKRTYNPDMIMTLNTTEFIFTPNLKDRLEELQDEYPMAQAFGMDSVVLVDPDFGLLCQEGSQLPHWQGHTWGYVDHTHQTRRPRYIHTREHGNYQLGRHDSNLPRVVDPSMLLLWWGFAPWPACKGRKLQIQTRIPQSDKDARLGFEHIQTADSLTEFYKEHLAKSYDLMSDKDYAKSFNSI